MRIRAIPRHPVAVAISEQTWNRSEQRETAGANLQFARQPADDACLQGQPCLFPGVQTSFKDEGFAAATYFLCQPGRITRSSRTALAMKDDGLAFVQRKLGLVQLG